MLGLASCQNEPEGLNVVTGGEVDTVVTVTLPEATRASSADSGIENVNDSVYDLRYILEVYDVTNPDVEPVFVYRAEDVKSTSVKTVTFPVRLIPERDYNFVVWADFISNVQNVEDAEDLYYYTTSKTSAKGVKYGLDNVTIAYGKWVAMDEARDAYTAVKYVESYNSGKSINLTLIRPFGKLRVITTDIAALDALAVNARPTAVKVTYKNGVYTGFNALTETGLNAGANAVFENTLSADQYEENDDENMVLFTDYIFGTENGTIQFELTATYANGNTSTNNFNTEIPIVRNYLTTISGNILTDGNDIRVDITDGFENGENPNNPPYYQETISSAAEFYAAVSPNPANTDKKYIVISALNLSSETISTLAATRAGEANGTTTIDLNGYTITVDNKNADGTALIAIDGQTIVFTDSSVNENTPEDEKGKIILTDNSAPLFDANNGAVVVEGGSVADGAVVGNFFVNDGENAGSSLALLQYICENGGEFTFSQDLEGNVTVYQKAGQNVVINGNGFDFNGTIYVYGNSRNNDAETVTIKNVNFISNDTRDFISSNSTDNDKRYAHNVTIEGCTFTGANGVDVVGVRFRQAYNITIKKCDAYDVHSLVQLSGCHNLLIENTDIKFVGDAGINLLSSINGANIDNCKINATEANGFGIRVDAQDGPMDVTNCKIDAYQPIVFRNSQNDFVVNLKDNTLVKSGSYDIYVASGECPTINVFDSNELVIGSDKDYYIANEASMRWFANAVNGGNTFAGKTVKLTADIDLNGKEWAPIGNSSNIFKGTFDGQNHTIKNLVVNGKGKSDQGLFGRTEDGEIKNLVVENAKVSGRLNVGVVAGTPYTSKYTKITVKGHVEVNGMAYVGAVGGKNAYADWTNITVNVDETSYVNANSVENGTAYRTYVGGVCGFNGEGGHSFKNITSNINVKGSTCDVGGLFGIAHYGNKFENCVCTGNVEIDAASEKADAQEIGGIAGVWHNETGYTVTFTNCSFTGTLKTNIEGVEFYNDGLVGKPYKENGTGKLIVNGKITCFVSTAKELDEALSNVNVKSIYLRANENPYTIDLYTKYPARESLTITGEEGTKVAFAKGQVRMALFKNFTIENCEILRMADKSWGHLVFGGGDKADGVYTVKNCTFNGVGTQGIYINESTSGATYNVLNCTFKGEFGDEGAVTIQNNRNVDFTVNVTNCKFEGVDNEHKVFIIGPYKDWSLITDLTDAEINWSNSNPNI